MLVSLNHWILNLVRKSLPGLHSSVAFQIMKLLVVLDVKQVWFLSIDT